MLYKLENNEFIGFYKKVNPIRNEKGIIVNEKEVLLADNNKYFDISLKKVEELLYMQNKEKKQIIFKNNELIAYLFPICKEYFVKEGFNWDIENWEEGATQVEFTRAKTNIEKEIVKLYKDIKTREELNLSVMEQNLKMIKFREQLNYVESKILIKV